MDTRPRTSKSKAKEHKDLESRRLKMLFLNQPGRDGNNEVSLPDLNPESNITRKMKKRMKSKIAKIMKTHSTT